MRVTRRSLLLASASIAVTAALPTGASAMATTEEVATTNAMQVVVNVVQRSLQAILREQDVNHTDTEAFGIPKLSEWLAVVDDPDALAKRIRKYLAGVHNRLRVSSFKFMSPTKPDEMGAFAQLVHVHKLPWSPHEGGTPEFFQALLELAPDDLKQRRS